MKIGKGRILVQKAEAPKTTRGGLVIPDAMREQPDFGEVVAVGAGVTDWKEGDKVVYPKWSGFVVNLPDCPDNEYLIILEEEVWGAI